MKWYEKQKHMFEQSDVKQSRPSMVSEEKVVEPIEEIPTPMPIQEPEYQAENQYVPEVIEEQNYQTIIAEKTLLVGDIESDCDLLIYGHVKGNVTCANNNITVCGEIEGSIECVNAILENAIVRDDVVCSGNMQVDSSSVVNGNIAALDVYINGKIKGDVKVEDVIRLGSSSIVIGSISAADIEIERGSIIQGGLMIRQDYVSEN